MPKPQLWILILPLLLTFSSCKTGIQNAKVAESHEQYYQAIEAYKKAYSGTKDRAKKAEVAYKIAELLNFNRNYPQAEIWYTKAQAMGYGDTKVHYQLGEVLKMNEKYPQALKEFELYEKDAPGDAKVKEQKDLIKAAQEWKSNPHTRFVVENFKQANSPQGDWSPYLKKDQLYFTSDRNGTTGKKIFNRTGGNYSDIYLMERKFSKDKRNVKWSAPALIDGDINTIMNEGTPYLDEKGTTMYYTQCNGTKGDSVKNCVVMEATKKGNKGWSNAVILPFCVDTTVDYGQPAISPDGQRLVFSCDMPGGKGKHDLYLSTYVKRSRTWSDPINLEGVINTEGDEMFPYWLNDTTLYFSSDGHIGMGGLDVYVTHGHNPGWSKPENLKYPVNSGGDDFGITFDEGTEAGFLTSNRLRSQGDDIYSFYLTPLIFTISGVVYNTKTNIPERNVAITLEGRNGSKKTIQTDDKGKYFFKLDRSVDYEVRAKKKNYFNSAPQYKTTKGLDYSADLVQDLTVSPQDVPITLKGIFYDLDKWELRPESKETLDSLVGIMNEYPYIVVEIGSHTDCRASYAYNDTLSQKRAKSVVDYLITKGVDAERMEAKGYGERMLLNNCACEDGKGPGMDCKEEEHQINRRSTFKVLRNDYTPKNAPKGDSPKDEGDKKKK
jgi:peptidoglycan-associated lipoprotein